MSMGEQAITSGERKAIFVCVESCVFVIVTKAQVDSNDILYTRLW